MRSALSSLILFILTMLFLTQCARKVPVLDKQRLPRATSNVLLDILEAHPDKFAELMKNRDKYRLQILYTQIDRDENNYPEFQSFAFNLNHDRYWYPASTIKLPAAVLAMEKLNILDIENVNIHTSLRIDSAAVGQSVVFGDDSSPDGMASIGHYIRKIMLVSDNDAYNRLYEFLGQKYIADALNLRGFENTKIIRRLESGGGPEFNRITNPFLFFGGENIFYEQGLVENPDTFKIQMADMKQGIGYMRGGELVNEPINFEWSNYMSLDDQQGLLRNILFPEVLSRDLRFDLTEEDYQFLYKYMSMLPHESRIAAYQDTSKYYDSYVKFFMFGDKKEPIPPHIRIFNKVGQAYGYLIDNAYIVDFRNNIEFLLSAVIQVNENQIYNDNDYEYDEIGYPFLAELGLAVYDYELKRVRVQAPDLSRFKIDYTGNDQ